jgi:hypothetical protein
MPIGLIFWVLMLIWLVFGVISRTSPASVASFAWGSDLLLFILFFLLGWHEFGFMIHQ